VTGASGPQDFVTGPSWRPGRRTGMLSLILKSEKKIPGRVSFNERSAMMSGFYRLPKKKERKRKKMKNQTTM